MKNFISKYRLSSISGRLFVLPFVLFILIFLVATTFDIEKSSFFLNAQLISKDDVFKPVIDRLKARGVDTAFINKVLLEPSVKFNEKFVKINVTGYLNKTDYSHNYNSTAITKTKEFISKYEIHLDEAESTFGVCREVIASIIYIETKLGTYVGNNNIASVFFSTALCNEDKYIELNKQAIRDNKNIKPEQYFELDKKIKERAQKKSEWALNEIIALEKIDKQKKIVVQHIKGSWAGAFGYPQFLPSSYISWAYDGDNDGMINLFNMVDAIFSVANYLQSNGWSSKSEDKRRAAIFHYNNSKDYVNAVLTLAEKCK